MTVQDSVITIQHQITSILEQLTDEQYRLSLDIFDGSTIGQHIRHIFDFYQCILQSQDQDKIDYNCRERNPVIEEERLTALGSLTQMVNEISRLNEKQILQVITDFSTDENELRPVVNSSVGRELMYAYDHAVHHLAIIKMGVQSAFPSVKLDKTIGIAPSTVKFQSRN